MTDTIDKLTGAKDKFKSGDLANKKDILLAIGQNPTLLNQSLTITPNEWLIPIAKSAKGMREQLEVVRTMPQQIQKASEEAVRSQWCRIPELFGSQVEAINGIAQEIEISTEYLGNSLRGDAFV